MDRRVLVVGMAWAVVAVSALGASGRLGADEPSRKASVELTIDYGDGVQKRFINLPHTQGMTVLDALQAAAKHSRGIKFTHRGKGETAFLTKIDDLENEGRGRNWTYRVNDKRADRSFGDYPLVAGDRVLWVFGPLGERP